MPGAGVGSDWPPPTTWDCVPGADLGLMPAVSYATRRIAKIGIRWYLTLCKPQTVGWTSRP